MTVMSFALISLNTTDRILHLEAQQVSRKTKQVIQFGLITGSIVFMQNHLTLTHKLPTVFFFLRTVNPSHCELDRVPKKLQ